MDDPNRPETEEDGIRAEALRRLRVRRLFKAAAPSQNSSPSQNPTPEPTASPSGDKPATPK